MGIKKLGKTDIPKSNVNWFEIVQGCKHPVPFDVANLMFNVAWCHAPTAYHGNHDAPLRKLNKFILLLK
jgi:hypothetical protein